MSHAWATGCFEGEGTILLNAEGRLTLELEQVDHTPLFNLREIFGGTINKRGTRDVWRWRLSKKADVHHALESVASHGHGSKARQASIVVAWLEGNHTLESTRKVLHHLKHDRTAVDAPTPVLKETPNGFRFQ